MTRRYYDPGVRGFLRAWVATMLTVAAILGALALLIGGVFAIAGCIMTLFDGPAHGIPRWASAPFGIIGLMLLTTAATIQRRTME